jgi:amidase
MTPDEYSRHDATGLAELIRTGEVSAMEVFEAFMSRVEAINPSLNAVVLPAFEAARSSISAGLPTGASTECLISSRICTHPQRDCH